MVEEWEEEVSKAGTKVAFIYLSESSGRPGNGAKPYLTAPATLAGFSSWRIPAITTHIREVNYRASPVQSYLIRAAVPIILPRSANSIYSDHTRNVSEAAKPQCSVPGPEF